METVSKYFIGTLLGILALSSLYFLFLFIGVPFVLTVPFAGLVLFFIIRWVSTAGGIINEPYSWRIVTCFSLCLLLLGHTALEVSRKYGLWDAWSIWNLHAKYLADPVCWKNLLRNPELEHIDYPLCLPAFTGFFQRLCGGHFDTITTFSFSLFCTIGAPVVLFSEVVRRNSLLAIAVLFLFARDRFYIVCGVAQYADIL